MGGPSTAARAFSPNADASYKLIYLAQRNPALDAAGFAQAWREHSQLAAKFGASLGSHFLGVHQCIKDHAGLAVPSFDNRYDGSSILAMKSWPDLLAARYHPHSLDEMLKDEARVFAGTVDDWTMAVEEHALLDGAPTGDVLLSFLTPQPEQTAADFAAQSRALAAELLRLANGAARIVWNSVIDKAPAYPFAVVIEIWFADRDAALAAACDPQVIAALEQDGIADPRAGARLLARLNHAKAF